MLRIESGTRTASATRSTLDGSTALPAPPPGVAPYSSTAAKASGRFSVSALEDNLDRLADKAEPFLGSYIIGSSVDRCEGGQGLVQFCSKMHRKEEYAIKCGRFSITCVCKSTQSSCCAPCTPTTVQALRAPFERARELCEATADKSMMPAAQAPRCRFYTHRPAFERERELYEATELKSMMPATHAIVDNADGSIKASNGYVWPPCIIIERGESLDQWAKREPDRDFVTTLQVPSSRVPLLPSLCHHPSGAFLSREPLLPRLCHHPFRCCAATSAAHSLLAF